MAEWQSRLHSTKGRDVFELYKEVKGKQNPRRLFPNQLVTGHGTIGTHQARLFNKSPSWQCGHPTEDRKHIIYQCTSMEQHWVQAPHSTTAPSP
ncbi:hypothetical protein CEXT_386521 [Caerostris extrusa]|uniref:Reverse transcriptase zinc-binding domain-containing protein n=1 Tax=Caerostris extrusa TaxID=172846 RepID=A0AAV4SKR1_CAEEX|nr:hypothetical protein CEXT_386521 [Caerostris extrusa]